MTRTSRAEHWSKRSLASFITGRADAWPVHRGQHNRSSGASLPDRSASTREQRVRSCRTEALGGQDQLITADHARREGSEVRSGITAPNVVDPAASGVRGSEEFSRSSAAAELLWHPPAAARVEHEPPIRGERAAREVWYGRYPAAQLYRWVRWGAARRQPRAALELDHRKACTSGHSSRGDHFECAVTVAGRLSRTASHDAAALSSGQLFGRAAALQICLSRVSWQSRVTHA